MAEGRTTLEDLKGAAGSARQAQAKAGRFSAAENTVGDVLKQRVQDAYNYNQDLVGKLDEQTAAYVSAPATAREEFQDIFNPFTREALVSQYTSNKMIPMLSTSNILGGRMGRIDDLIGSGTRAFEAQSQAATNQATLARQGYQDLVSQYKLEEEKRRKDRQYMLDLMEAQQSGGGGVFEDPWEAFRAFKPTGAQRTQSTMAKTALENTQQIRNQLLDEEGNLRAGSKGQLFLAKRKPIIGNTLAKLTGSNVDQVATLRRLLDNVSDIMARGRTGAAINQYEQKLYENLAPIYPDIMSGDSSAIKSALDLMENTYSTQYEAGQLPLWTLTGDVSQAPNQIQSLMGISGGAGEAISSGDKTTADQIYGY